MTRSDTAFDRILAQSDLASLSPGDDAVVAAKQIVEHLVRTDARPKGFHLADLVHPDPRPARVRVHKSRGGSD